ncbi:hypothetical protein TNCV_4705921 [Trichonephila clavipes]|nr:hypothetical protein TNCV_4705921 [Trichonephila clavipes]
MGGTPLPLDTEDGSLFGEPPKRSEGRPPRSQPLNGPTECLEDCSGGPDSQTWERSHVSGIPPTYFLLPICISTRLNDFLETNKILIPEQHGFRPVFHYSSITQSC